MKSTGLCSSKLLLLLLIIVLTIVVVNIALNSFNKEMFSNNNTGGAALFHSNLLPQLLQTEVNHINERNPAAADNNLLSAKHLKQVYETRRPELITPNNKSPQKLCYIDLESL